MRGGEREGWDGKESSPWVVTTGGPLGWVVVWPYIFCMYGKASLAVEVEQSSGDCIDVAVLAT